MLTMMMDLFGEKALGKGIDEGGLRSSRWSKVDAERDSVSEETF